jgi:hypothetical protein
MRWEYQGWCQLHTSGSGELELTWAEPYESYDMGRYGRVVVEAAGLAVAVDACGRRLSSVSRLWEEPPGHSVGVVLDFEGYALAAANLGDELCFAVWPDQDWRRQGIRVVR